MYTTTRFAKVKRTFRKHLKRSIVDPVNHPNDTLDPNNAGDMVAVIFYHHGDVQAGHRIVSKSKLRAWSPYIDHLLKDAMENDPQLMFFHLKGVEISAFDILVHFVESGKLRIPRQYNKYRIPLLLHVCFMGIKLLGNTLRLADLALHKIIKIYHNHYADRTTSQALLVLKKSYPFGTSRIRVPQGPDQQMERVGTPLLRLMAESRWFEKLPLVNCKDDKERGLWARMMYGDRICPSFWPHYDIEVAGLGTIPRQRRRSDADAVIEA